MSAGYNGPGNYGPPSRFPLPWAIVPFPQSNYQYGGRPPPPQIDPDAEPLDFLMAVMRDPGQPMDRRMDAAKAAMPYRHTRLAPANITDETGIKINITGGLPQDEKVPG
jgi:hypothetical protein